MLQVKIGSNVVNFGLIIVNMQNCFVSNGGSYDKLGINRKIKDFKIFSIDYIFSRSNYCVSCAAIPIASSAN